ncbi:hypothetical protein KI659_00805 [Litoribacter alkaliphilus]|uniref:Addiction module protein n=1 Tax=Litoribacter ruber TaxID=702568 RepID=A0AAP2CE01_9BACT|nr:hypothetical protein [Litoribacter alkaliphilus]MBS9522541.1 hypothetical protein [Litoribacter alkaliphilus]
MGIKEKIIEKVQNIEDEDTLEHLLEIINAELDLEEEVYQLSQEERASILEGEQDIKEGRTHTQEEVRKITDEWFKKR